MKRNQWFNLFVTGVVCVAAASTALAKGTDFGNGGDGVLDAATGVPYLLDLVEAGVEKSPWFDPQTHQDPETAKRLKDDFGKLEGVPYELLAKKLREIADIAPLLSGALEYSLRQYAWRPINLPLADIKDEDTLVDVPASRLVQLAARSSRMIKVDRALWDRMDDANRVALVLHEAMYALIKPEAIDDSGYSRQSSPRVREIIGLLFTDGDPMKTSRLNELAKNVLPTGVPTQVVGAYGSALVFGGMFEIENGDLSIPLAAPGRMIDRKNPHFREWFASYCDSNFLKKDKPTNPQIRYESYSFDFGKYKRQSGVEMEYVMFEKKAEPIRLPICVHDKCSITLPADTERCVDQLMSIYQDAVDYQVRPIHDFSIAN